MAKARRLELASLHFTVRGVECGWTFGGGGGSV